MAESAPLPRTPDEPGDAPRAELETIRRRLGKSLAKLDRASSPLERVERAREARELAERLESEAIHAARAEKVSWAKLGAVYGLTKQGAQQRFGGKRPGASEAPGDPGTPAAADPAARQE